MQVFELFAKLGLDTSEYDKGLTGAKGALSTFGSAVTTGFNTIAKVGATAMTAATAATVAFGASSVKVGAEFDTSMSQVAATMGFTKDQLNTTGSEAAKTFETLRNFAQEMGRTTQFSATESAEALNYMALAGYNAEDSIKMLPTVLNLAASGAMDLGSASDMVTDAQSALGLTTEQTMNMVDQMAAAASNSNTSVSQLGSAMLTIGATAKNLKGGTVELSTVLGKLADNGIKGAEGGTHLRNILLSLQTPTKEGTAALQQLGMSYDEMYDSAGNMRSLPEIFQEMSGKMEGMTQASKDAIVSGVFNKTDLAAVNALLNTNSEQWNNLTDKITKSKGAAEEMAGVQMDNLEGDIKLFQSALEGAQIAISDGLTPTFREFVSFGSDGVSKLTEAFKDGGIKGAFEEVGNFIGGLTVKITEKTPEVIDAALGLMGAFGQGLIDNAPIIFSAMMTIGDMIGERLLTLGERLSEWLRGVDWRGVATDISEFMKGGLTQTAGEFASLGLDIINSLASGLAESAPVLLPAAIDTIANFVNFLAEQTPQLISTATDLIIGFAEGLTEPNSLSNLISSAINLIMALVDGLIQALPKLYEAAPVIVQNLCKAIAENGPELLVSAAELILKLELGLIQALPELLKAVPEIIAALVGEFIAGSGSMMEAASGLMNSFHEALLSFDPYQWGKDMIDSFADGIESSLSYVRGLIEDLADSVSDLIGFSEPKEGPLSNFHTYAPDMMALFAKGIKDNTGLVTDQIENSFDFEDIIKDQSIDISGNVNGKIKGNTVNGNVESGFVQNLTINAPQQLNPSEIARQTKNANREFVLRMRMA